MKSQINILLILLLLSPVLIKAQINMPSLSPRLKTEQKVGLTNVKLDYGQPSVKGRVIFGGLIPYERLWRTGANSSTKISIDREVEFAGTKVPAGDYSLYSIPGEKKWTIIINKNTGLWGAGGYNSEEDQVRFIVPSIKLKDKIETFTIYFENFHANGGDMVIAWENTKVVIPVFEDSDEKIYQEIEEKLINAKGEISPQTYFDAAQFYYQKNKKLDQAVVWFDKAIEMRPKAFWYTYYRAEIAHFMKDNDTAEKKVRECLAMAQAGSYDFGYIAKCDLLMEKLGIK